jgi:hypothetical protein
MRHLVESGVLERDADGQLRARQPVEDLGIPEGVKEVIGRRLSRLSVAANRALLEQLSNVVDRPHEGSQAAAFSSSVVASSPVTFTPSLNVAPSPTASNPRRASLAPLDT